MSLFDTIHKPTLLLNEQIVRQNIQRIKARTVAENVRFRPHFKTHRSAEIGEWFRHEDIRAITVSSLEMAAYFARYGWDDITVAFPVNLREIETINQLAAQVRLGLLFESRESARFIEDHLHHPVDAWIKVDSGAHRTGLGWDQPQAAAALAGAIAAGKQLRFRGLLTHAGHTYQAVGAEAITRVYSEAVDRINTVRQAVLAAGLPACEVSVGDTPGAVCSPSLGQVDEIRPGNFVFFDCHQMLRQVCAPEDIAVAVACPVVARHPERNELVLYGGGIHLSKDFVQDGERRVYGLAALPQDCGGWGALLPGAYMRSLSQEHGILYVPGPEFDQIEIGSLVCILPAHSCLTVQVMGRYTTLDGHVIQTLNCQGTA